MRYVVFLSFLVAVSGCLCVSYGECARRQQVIRQELDRVNHCAADSDCVVLGLEIAENRSTCFAYINSRYNGESITSLIEGYSANCGVPEIHCMPKKDVACIGGKCMMKPKG